MNISAYPYFWLGLMIGILILDKCWFLYLYYRQMKVFVRSKKVPEKLKSVVTAKNYRHLRYSGLKQLRFTFFNRLVAFMIVGIFELYFGLFPLMWNVSACICNTENEIFINVLFVALLCVYISFKFLPAKIYNRWFLNRDISPFVVRSDNVFIKSRLSSMILNQVYLLPLTMLVTLIIDNTEQIVAILLLSVVAVTLSLISLLILPLITEFLLYKSTRLRPGKYKEELNRLVNKVEFQLKRIFVIDTADLGFCGNAYFAGCCCIARIMIYDTMFANKKMTTQNRHYVYGLSYTELAAVVAHELGHWKKWHMYITVLLMQIHLIIATMLMQWFSEFENIYEAVGFEPGEQPAIVGLILGVWFIIIPYLRIVNVILLAVFRNLEFRADKYAWQLGYGASLSSALIKQYSDCPQWPVFDYLYFIFHFDHPTILKRLDNLEKYEVKPIPNEESIEN